MSADALLGEDIDLLRTTETWQKYLGKASGIRCVKSIYPTITFPCHATMLTGVYPDKHGVVSNLQFYPGRVKAPWRWYRSFNKWPTDLFFAAKEKGLSTAAVFWPGTGKHPAIDYLINECWPTSTDINKQFGYEDFLETFTENGSSHEVRQIIERHLPKYDIMQHPAREEFVMDCTIDIIRTFRPDVLFLHPSNIDSARHKYGLYNDKVDEEVLKTASYIERIFTALLETVDLDEINFVLTSDHGHLNIDRIISLNLLFKEAGWIKTDEEGRWLSWEACAISGGTSACVYADPNLTPDRQEELEEFVYSLQNPEQYGISLVLTAPEAQENFHFAGDFQYVLETDGHSSFSDSVSDPLVHTFDVTDYRYGHATHGHMPHKGPSPVFYGVGPAFKQEVLLDTGKLIDIAPTLAQMLGVDLGETDGKVVEEILDLPKSH